jgi:tetrahydromethanopterin S-methyltransferase subunit D
MDPDPSVYPVSIRRSWLRALLLINSAVWFVFCVQGLFSNSQRFGLPSGSSWIISVLMAGNGLVLMIMALIIVRGSRLVLFLAAGFVSVNAVLSITDQVGFWDYLVLGLNLVILVLLLIDFKSHFVRKGKINLDQK